MVGFCIVAKKLLPIKNLDLSQLMFFVTKNCPILQITSLRAIKEMRQKYFQSKKDFSIFSLSFSDKAESEYVCFPKTVLSKFKKFFYADWKN